MSTLAPSYRREWSPELKKGNSVFNSYSILAAAERDLSTTSDFHKAERRLPGRMKELRRLWVAIGLVCWLAESSTFAQAPKIGFLFPAGMQRGQKLDVTLNGTPGTLPLEVHVIGEGLTGTIDEKGKTLTVEATAETLPGLRWLRFYNAQGASEPLPFLVGDLPEVQETEPNNLIKETTPLALPVVVNGIVHKADEVDLFAVELEAGQTLVASVVANDLLGSPMDSVIQLLAPNGFVIEQNDDDHGTDSLIAYQAVQSGPHYVRVFAFPSAPNSSVRFHGGENFVYRLTLTAGPFLDHVAPAGDGQVIPRGWNLPADSLPFEQVLLFPTFQTPETLARLAAAASTEETRSDRRLSVPDSVIGRIIEEETGTYSIDLKKDQNLDIAVRGQFSHSPLDPVLKILDADGKVLRENDDVSRNVPDAFLNWKVPADGTYRLQVSDRYGHGSWRHLYLLSVDEVSPTVQLNVNAPQFVMEAGKSIEVTIDVARGNNFAEELTISAEGLPEGVTSDPVVSAAKGDSAKSVKLKLTAAADMAANASFTIVGRRESAPGSPVLGTAKLKSAGATTESIWLTVLPSK